MSGQVRIGLSTNQMLARLVLALCIVYMLIFAAIPLLMAWTYADLPYLHTWTDSELFLASGLAAVVVVLATSWATCLKGGDNFSSPVEDRDAKTWLHKLICIAVLTTAAAAGCENTFGALVKIFPGRRYQGVVTIVDVGQWRSKRHRHPSIEIDLCDSPGGTMRHLTLSTAFFPDPEPHVGDIWRLEGKQNMFGIDVDSFQVVAEK